MNTPEQHEMELVAAFGDIEEWHCPSCGRRFLLRWAPLSKRVIEPGDEQAIHGGSRQTAEVDDPYLAPFTAWWSERNR